MNQRQKCIFLPSREKVGIARMRGFTLLELLIVVIIVAVLAAVALPQYKRAALKSRFSKVMPVAKAIADANEVFYLGQNYYANNTEKDMLDVSAAPDTTVELPTQEQEEQYNYVATSRSDAPGLRYIVYQKHSPKFAENIHCEAQAGEDEDNDAVAVCRGLGGQTEITGSINTSTGNYRTFLLAGVVGSGDKLPSSLTKLAASLEASQCAGKTNCTATVKGNEVVVAECGTSMGYTFVGSGYQAPGCRKTLYNAESVETGAIFEICSGSNSVISGSSCLPASDGNGLSFARVDQDRNSPTFGKQLLNASGFDCIQGIGCATFSTLRLIDGQEVGKWYSCSSGQIVNLETLECEEY